MIYAKVASALLNRLSPSARHDLLLTSQLLTLFNIPSDLLQ